MCCVHLLWLSWLTGAPKDFWPRNFFKEREPLKMFQLFHSSRIFGVFLPTSYDFRRRVVFFTFYYRNNYCDYCQRWSSENFGTETKRPLEFSNENTPTPIHVLERSNGPIRLGNMSFGWVENASLNFRDDQSSPETSKQTLNRTKKKAVYPPQKRVFFSKTSFSFGSKWCIQLQVWNFLPL